MKPFILTLSLVQISLLSHAAGLKNIADIQKGGSSNPVGNQEVCIIPQNFPLSFNVNKDPDDTKKEEKLCKMSFYQSEKPLKQFVTCPKLNSTNPGVLVVEIPTIEDAAGNKTPKYTAEETANKFCKTKSAISAADKKDYSVKAKFKQSITCSYAPSALAAYHVSRMLGGVVETPVAVVRTMDRKKHQEVINKALTILDNNQGDIIYKSWSQFNTRSSSASEPKLYADGGRYLYGALSENITKEYIYTEVSGVGPYDTRYPRFIQQNPFLRVASADSVESIVKQSKTSEVVVQQQMKDVSDMIVIDTLLSQDDRIGNIHFHLYWAKIEGDKIIRKALRKSELAAVEKYFAGKPLSRVSEYALAAYPATVDGVLTRVMTLKDNDCGVDVDKRSNNMRVVSAIEQVRHLSPKTYNQLKEMKRLVDNKDPDFTAFFMNTLLYRPVDFSGPKPMKSFVNNLERIMQVVDKNIASGFLKLDLVSNVEVVVDQEK